MIRLPALACDVPRPTVAQLSWTRKESPGVKLSCSGTCAKETRLSEGTFARALYPQFTPPFEPSRPFSEDLSTIA